MSWEVASAEDGAGGSGLTCGGALAEIAPDRLRFRELTLVEDPSDRFGCFWEVALAEDVAGCLGWLRGVALTGVVGGTRGWRGEVALAEDGTGFRGNELV